MPLFTFQTKHKDLDFDTVGIIEADTAQKAAEMLLAKKILHLEVLGSIVIRSDHAEQDPKNFFINIIVSIRWTKDETGEIIHTDSWNVWPANGEIISFKISNGRFGHVFMGL